MQTCSVLSSQNERPALGSPAAPAASMEGTFNFPEPFADAPLPDPPETQAEKLRSRLGKGPGRAGSLLGERCLFRWPRIICQEMMVASNAFII